MNYYITTFCYGEKYTPIKDIWCNRINNKCKNGQIVVFTDISVLNNSQFQPNFPGYFWALRFKHNLDLLLKYYYEKSYNINLKHFGEDNTNTILTKMILDSEFDFNDLLKGLLNK